MRNPDKKKTISNEVIFNVIGIVGVILLVPIFITFVFWYLDTNVLQQVDENFLNTFVSHSKEIVSRKNFLVQPWWMQVLILRREVHR